MKLNKYSSTITVANDTSADRHYIFYNNELVAFGTGGKFFVEEKDLRKKSVIDYIENTYDFKHNNAEINTCFSLNNMLYLKDEKRRLPNNGGPPPNTL